VEWKDVVERAMAKRYQHPLDEMRIDIANRAGGVLWGATETDPESTTETKAETDEPD
jgi:hypothetical protein